MEAAADAVRAEDERDDDENTFDCVECDETFDMVNEDAENFSDAFMIRGGGAVCETCRDKHGYVSGADEYYFKRDPSEGDSGALGHDCTFCAEAGAKRPALYKFEPVDAATHKPVPGAVVLLCAGCDELYPSSTDRVFFCHRCEQYVVEREGWRRDDHKDSEGYPVCERCVLSA